MEMTSVEPFSLDANQPQNTYHQRSVHRTIERFARTRLLFSSFIPQSGTKRLTKKRKKKNAHDPRILRVKKSMKKRDIFSKCSKKYKFGTVEKI